MWGPLQFQKIFAVGLPSRTDRRDAIVLEAALSNLDVEFSNGVSGADVAQKALHSVYEGAKPGEIGAWRGHMNAIQE